MKVETRVGLFPLPFWPGHWCPTCGSTLKEFHPELMNINSAQQPGPVEQRCFVEVFDDEGVLICTSTKWQSLEDGAILQSLFIPAIPMAYRDRYQQWHTNLLPGMKII